MSPLRILRYLFKSGLYSIVPIGRFLLGPSGQEYDVGFFKKLGLVLRCVLNSIQIETATPPLELVTLVDEILRIPKDLEGHVFELGCYKGGSTASLSLACSMVNRKLIVCDSFLGLPEPVNGESVVYNLSRMCFVKYNRGDYYGRLDEVKENVARHGRLDVCEFVQGDFQDTLPERNERCVLVFEDADLPSSVATALQYTWPRLHEGCKFFTQEAQDLEVAALFFDKEWWPRYVGSLPPGLVGAGIGLPLSMNGSGLGYAVKRK